MSLTKLTASIAVFFALCTIFFNTAGAQSGGGTTGTILQDGEFQIFLPLVIKNGRPDPVGPFNREIVRTDCTDRGFEISSATYPNGTILNDLPKKYWMNSVDFLTANPGSLFPGGVVKVFDGLTRVCLPKAYKLLWESGSGRYVDFDGGRPDWAQHLQFSSAEAQAIAASAAVSDTYVFLGISIPASGDWLGNPVVGTLKSSNGTMAARIARFVSGSRGALLLRGVGAMAGLAPIIDRIAAATSEGLAVPASELDGGAAVIYYAVETTQAYFRCYQDAVLVADGLLVPNIRRLYLFGGSGNAGCILASVALGGGVGDKAYDFAVAEWAATRSARLAQTSDDLAKDLIEALDVFYQNRKSDKPIPVPTEPANCPEIYEDWIIVESLNMGLQYVEYRIRNGSAADEDEVLDLIDYMIEARENLNRQLLLQARYLTKSPRGTLALAHVTSQVAHVDPQGNHWNIEVVCLWTVFEGYVWYPEPTGRTISGIFRTGDPGFVSPNYPFKFED